jgi:hypothetical protein
LWVSAFFRQSFVSYVFFWALSRVHDRIAFIRSRNHAAPQRFRRIEMKNKKEQKTKIQPKNGKKAIAESSAPKIEKPEAKRTIKQVVIEAITANNVITNDELIAAVKVQFPKSAFKDSHAAWYRSQARKGLLTGTPIEIPAQRQAKSGN